MGCASVLARDAGGIAELPSSVPRVLRGTNGITTPTQRAVANILPTRKCRDWRYVRGMALTGV
jgi:hypothetical protein